VTGPAGGMPEAIVLAGGLGTRLKGVIAPDLPKLLAPVHGRPFLDYLLAWLAGQGVTRIAFALGHGAAAAIPLLSAAQGRFAHLRWTVEASPLGTAGAIATAIAGAAPDPRLILNGDTLADVRLADLCAGFHARKPLLALVAAQVADPGRYGRLDLDDAGQVRRFAEKSAEPAGSAPAWINAGIYLAGQEVLSRTAALGRGSFEREVMMALPPGAIWAHCAARRFIDIGTGSSLAEAQAVLAPLDTDSTGTGIWAGTG